MKKSRTNRNSAAASNNNKLVKIIVALIIGIVIVGAAIVFAINYFNTKEMRDTLDTDTIYPNVLVNDINVGGLKKEDALKKLEKDLQEPFSQNKISFAVDDDIYDFTYGQLGIKCDLETAVEQAYNYGRESDLSIEERYEKYETLKLGSPYSFDANFLNEDGHLSDEVKETIRTQLETLKDKVYIEPKNATIKKENGQFVVVTETKGRELDLDRAVDIVVEFVEINQGDGTLIYAPTKEVVDAPAKDVQAKVTSEQLSQIGDVIGKYSTNYRGSGSSGRVINMRVAASRLNGTVLYPGEVFSTNDCFGESTPKNGYKLAGAYINGKLSEDYGGGVCQVSSTLYNAVLRAELEVVERANHSLTVGYVPRGFDATLAGNYIDFKFKNNFSIPIYIESALTSNQVIITIYGKEEHSKGRTLDFKSVFDGKSYKTYKYVYQDGKFVEKIYLAKSVYKNVDSNGNLIVTTDSTSTTTTETPVETTTNAVPSIPKETTTKAAEVPKKQPKKTPVETAPVTNNPAVIEEITVSQQDSINAPM